MDLRPFALITAAMLLSTPIMAKNVKVDVCHWDADAQTFHVINISENAVDAHMSHGDVYPGEYWFDADGDGYGDPAGAGDVCPNTGFVDNADDCDDTDATVHPAAEEVCGDGVDNDCDADVDEDCVSCPCWTAEALADLIEADLSLSCNTTSVYTGIVGYSATGQNIGRANAYLGTYQGCHYRFDWGSYPSATLLSTSLAEAEACMADVEAACAALGF